jgi:hypothetical protein
MITYEREPVNAEDKDEGGYTSSSAGYSDVKIFYLQPNYGPSGKTVMINGQEVDEYKTIGFVNEIDSQVGVTIRHEIGHTLGLDHPKFTEKDFKMDSNGNLVSPSIMIDVTNMTFDQDPIYKITSYDIDALVNLYGTDGISEFSIYDYLGYIVLAVVIALVIIVIRKRKKKKSQSMLKNKIVQDSISTRDLKCPKCNNSILSDWDFCNGCGNLLRE